MVSSTRRTAGCGPACPVVWQGRVGDYSPYADLVLSLDTNHLVQSVDVLHQIALRRHYRFDGLVGRGRFIDDLGVLTAFDARRHALVVFHGEPPLRFRAGHRAPGPVAAAHETLHVPFAAHNIGTRSHAAGNDAHVAFACAHRALACHQDVLAVVAVERYVVVVTIDGLQLRDEGPHFAGITDRANDLLHHQVAVPACKILRPFDGFHIIVEVL